MLCVCVCVREHMRDRESPSTTEVTLDLDRRYFSSADTQGHTSCWFNHTVQYVTRITAGFPLFHIVSLLSPYLLILSLSVWTLNSSVDKTKHACFQVYHFISLFISEKMLSNNSTTPYINLALYIYASSWCFDAKWLEARSGSIPNFGIGKILASASMWNQCLIQQMSLGQLIKGK